MKQIKYIHWFTSVLLLLVALLATTILSLAIGENSYRLPEVLSILKSGEGIDFTIITRLRMPRIILAFAIGGALSLSGTILQGIYRNPLVEPYTLGISGGAAFAVSLAIVLELHSTIGSYVLPLSGFIGAFTTVFIVYFLSVRRANISINRMLLIGVMISFIASSAMMFLMAVSSSESLHGIVFWIMGSLDEPNTSLINTMVISATAGLLISYLYVNPLNALRLGETKARHLGFNTASSIKALFLLASVLAGFCVAIAGVIGFVGLVIPHIMRQLIGSDYRILLISSFLGGSIFLIVSDIISRVLVSPNELPIGVITGILGGMVFIFVLSRNYANKL